MTDRDDLLKNMAEALRELTTAVEVRWKPDSQEGQQRKTYLVAQSRAVLREYDAQGEEEQ